VNSPTCITLENNEKIRPQLDRENAFAGASGGDEVRRFDFARLYYQYNSVTYKNNAPQNVLQLVLQNLVAADPIPDKLGNGNAPGWLTGGA